MKDSARTTRQQLSEFALTATGHGWTGKFPGEPCLLFGKEICIHIDTRHVRNDPKILPPISISQATLVRRLVPALPAILKQVEEAMATYHNPDANFREFIRNPHVWLDSEHDDGESWTFVINRTDNPNFGYHNEFKGTDFQEIWAVD